MLQLLTVIVLTLLDAGGGLFAQSFKFALFFGKRGAQLLADVHCDLFRKGGVVPVPPKTVPAPIELPYGSGIWYLGGAIAVLALLAYLKPKGG